MKKTTKILIGTLLGILLLCIGFLAYVASFRGPEDDFSPSDHESNLIARPLPAGITHLRLETDGSFTEYAAAPRVALSFSDSVQGGGMLRIPRELDAYVETKQIGTTLVFHLIQPEKLARERKARRIAPFSLKLTFPEGSLREISGDQDFVLTLSRYETDDTLHVSMQHSSLTLADSCAVGKLIVQGLWQLKIYDSRIDTLVLNAGDLRHWDIQRNRIGHVDIYSESNLKIGQKFASGCTINWHPLSDRASLSLTDFTAPLRIVPAEQEKE